MQEFSSTLKEMTSRDLQDVLFVSGTALEIKEADEQLSEVLCLLEQIFKTGNNNFYFACSSGKELDLNRVVSRGIEKKFFPRFRKYYHKLDPFYRILSLGPLPTVIVRDHSKNKGRLTEYYSDFLKPQSIHYQMSIYLKSKHRFLGVIGLYRPSNAKEFSSLDQAKANLMAPYLAGALEKSLISEQKNEQDAILNSILSDLPYPGILVLDRSLRPIYENQYAVRAIAHLNQARSGQNMPLGALPKEIELPCQKLLRFTQLDEETEPPHQHLELTCQPEKEKLAIHLRLINPSAKNPLLLVYFAFEAYECDVLNRIRQYGLSQRQGEVVFLLSKGLTNKEIGNRLFISTYTVENHLKAIYEKMNVKNRTELSYRLQQTSAA
jgi:DNA-binding CsgD family transcriptional regulator